MHMDLPSLKSNLIGGVDKIFKSGEPVNKGRYYYKLWLSGDRYGKGIPLGSLRKGESSYHYNEDFKHQMHPEPTTEGKEVSFRFLCDR
jgi:hypothetical protein